MEIFESYEQEFTTLRQSILQKISKDIPNAPAGSLLCHFLVDKTNNRTIDKRKLLFSQLERELEEADEIVRIH